MSMDEFNQVSHVNIYDLFKVAEVSVIGKIIVAICMLSAVVQVLKIPASGTSFRCGEKGL